MEQNPKPIIVKISGEREVNHIKELETNILQLGIIEGALKKLNGKATIMYEQLASSLKTESFNLLKFQKERLGEALVKAYLERKK